MAGESHFPGKDVAGTLKSCRPTDPNTPQAMFDTLEADIVVMQETKIQRKDLSDDMVLVPGWDVFFSLPKYKKGSTPVPPPETLLTPCQDTLASPSTHATQNAAPSVPRKALPGSCAQGTQQPSSANFQSTNRSEDIRDPTKFQTRLTKLPSTPRGDA